MLLCNFRAIDRWPPLWARSAEIRAEKGGGLVMRTGALDGNAASAGCQPVRPTASACLPAKAPCRSNRLTPRRSPCPARNWLTGQPPDRRRYTPEIGEPSALLLISGREAWPRGVEVDGGRFSSRDGPRTGTGSPGRRCGSPRRLLALAPWSWARLGHLT